MARKQVKEEATLDETNEGSAGKPVELKDLKGLGPATIDKLNSAGIDSILSLAVTPPSELSEVSGLSEPNCRKLIQQAREALDMGFINAEVKEQQDTRIYRVSTGSKDFDAILDGGIESGSISEAYGQYGSGKSQLAQQLSVNVLKMFPEGVVVYIDTENSFKPKRVRQMAVGQKMNEEDVLQRIQLAKAYSFDHQLFLADKVEEMVKRDGNVKLIVVDSLMNHLRAESAGRGQLADRQQKLNRYLHKLGKLADLYNVPVFVTNQVMADPGSFFGDPTRPVGGNIAGHALKFRIYLRRGKNDTRVAKLVDSPHLADSDCSFVVTENGIETYEG